MDTGIEELPVPLVCQAETHAAAVALSEFITDFEANLAF